MSFTKSKHGLPQTEAEGVSRQFAHASRGSGSIMGYEGSDLENGRKLPKMLGKLAWSYLDIGCRRGYFLRGLRDSEVMGECVGVDIVPEYIDEAQEYGLDARLADAHALPFPDSSFDVVHCSHTLEHCVDPAQVAKEVLRVARNLILVIQPLEDPTRHDPDQAHYWQSPDPLDWIGLFHHPDWKFISCLSIPCECTFVLVPYAQEHLWKAPLVFLPTQ